MRPSLRSNHGQKLAHVRLGKSILDADVTEENDVSRAYLLDIHHDEALHLRVLLLIKPTIR